MPVRWFYAILSFKNVALLSSGLFLGIYLWPLSAQGQGLLQPADTLHQKRLTGLVSSGAALYSTALVGLNELWYTQYERSAFHFTNERRHWQQMDKAGHAFTAYYESVGAYHLLQWCGVETRKSLWYGGLTGFLLQTPIEILDGFSRRWGASPGDILANAAGSALFIGQQAGWQEQRFRLKFSHAPTSFPAQRPDLLGSNAVQELLKDYNSQTYWIATPANHVIPGSNPLPEWLDLAAGYSANGMLGSKRNPETFRDQVRYRQYLLAPDIDISHFETRSRFVNNLLDVLSILKVPLPGLQYSPEKGFTPHAIAY